MPLAWLPGLAAHVFCRIGDEALCLCLLSALRCHLNMCPFVNRYECVAGTGPVQLNAIGLIRLVLYSAPV